MATKTLTLYPYNCSNQDSRFDGCFYGTTTYSDGKKITYSTGSTEKYLGDLCSND